MLRSPAVWLFLVLAAAIAADLVLREGQTLLFLSRKGVELVHWLAFWR